MEYIAGDDLYTLIKAKKKLPEIEAAYLLKGVVQALDALHKYKWGRFTIFKKQYRSSRS